MALRPTLTSWERIPELSAITAACREAFPPAGMRVLAVPTVVVDPTEAAEEGN
jgi:hypothetical protein